MRKTTASRTIFGFAILFLSIVNILGDQEKISSDDFDDQVQVTGNSQCFTFSLLAKGSA